MPLAAQACISCAAPAVFGSATPSARAPCSARFRSFWCRRMRKPGLKVRLIMRSPCTSRMRLAAKPPISAWRTLAGSAPALLANTSASPTAAMFSATMIWLATLRGLAVAVAADQGDVLAHQLEQRLDLARTPPAVPPTMIVSEAALAPTSPPDTGASR